MDLPALFALSLCSLAGCAAIGGVIAHQKKRRPGEGLVLGLFLGPIGVLVEARLPAIGRPEVCQDALHSFQSMLTYQDHPAPSPRDRDPGRRRRPS